MSAKVAVHPTSVELTPSDYVDTAIRTILADCVAQISGNIVAMRLNSGAIHQARIGLRRTRSVLDMFKDQVDQNERRLVNDELRRIGAVLGPARNLDVFLSETLPKIAKEIGKREQGHLELARTHALDQRLGMPDVVKDWSTSGFAIQIGTITLNGKHLDRPIIKIAPKLLDREAKRVKRRSKHLDSVGDRHALRKAIKRLRYNVEVLSPLFDPDDVKRYLVPCREAQSLLGVMNDAATTIEVCQSLVDQAPVAAKLIKQWATKQQGKQHNLKSVVKQLRSARPFWH